MSIKDLQQVPADSWLPSEREVIGLADSALDRGKQLYRWFQSSNHRPAEPPGFSLGQTFRPEDRFGGFYDVVTIDGKRIPVMAADQVTFFDRLKSGETGRQMDVEEFAQQVRVFVLRYFLTMCEYRQQEEVSTQTTPLPAVLQELSWYPAQRKDLGGFAFAKLAVKKRRTGEVFGFTESAKNRPIDLENLRDEYQWLMMKTILRHAALNLTPFGARGPQIVLQVPEGSYLVMDNSLLIDQKNPEPGVLGRYGCSYSMIHYRRDTWPFVYGPGQFEVGVQMNVFDVLESGYCRVRQTFIVNQPRRLLSFFGFDPLLAFIDSANLFTLGLAGSRMGISRDAVNRFILFDHSMMTYNTLVATLRTFRHDDWLQLERDGRLPDELIGRGIRPAARASKA